jgi:DNA-binding response OmpR family regulator
VYLLDSSDPLGPFGRRKFERATNSGPVTNKILIVDDDPFIQTVLSGLLVEFGYAVACASSGTEGLEMLSQERYSGVLLDLYMDDISGLDVLAEAREKWDSETLPILMISAEEDESSVGVALDFGANDFLIKPINAESLRSKLKSHLSATHMGPYKLQSVLRKSDTSTVYQALDLRLQRAVEVKISPRAKAEALVLAQINHPNVVAVYDCCFEDTPFLVSEVLEGKSMSELAGARLVDALIWLRELLLGLAAVHQKGFVHAELQPSSLVLTPSKRVKLIEFGSACAIQDPADVRVDLDACLGLLKFWLGQVSAELEETVRTSSSADSLRAALRPHLNRAFRS